MSGPAARDLGRIPPRFVPAILEFVYGALAENPQRVGKPLSRELEGVHGARRGSYRVLYVIYDEHEKVPVVRIDHRAGVYRPR